MDRSSSPWDSPVLAARPLACDHAGPCLAGPPQVSPDGHWWWDGRVWAPRRLPTEVPDPAATTTAAAPAA